MIKLRQLPGIIGGATAPVVAGFTCIALLAACGSDTKSSTSSATSATAPATTAGPGTVLQVRAMDDMFTGPTSIAAGMTTVELANAGPQPHQVQFLRLHDGVGIDQAMAAAKAGNPGALLALADPAGGANAVGPNSTQTVHLDLTAGTYVEVCFVPDPDGTPHVAKGMISPLTVTPSSTSIAAPTTIGAVTLDDFSFDLPDPFAGKGTLEVVDNGTQPHEMTIVKLNDGTTVDDVDSFFADQHPSGPPPFAYAGGMGALAPGQTGYVDLDLQPGDYAAICLVTDPKTHQPHIMLGMSKGFTVTA